MTSSHKCIIFFILSIIFLSSCTTIPPIQIPDKEPVSQRLKHLHPNVVLVLGSGSARGFAHAGVLKVLEENHIPIDLIVGTSAGAIVGSLYADHPSADWLIRLLLTTHRNEVIEYSLLNIRQGIISGTKVQSFLINHMRAKTFDELPIPFVAVATNLLTGRIHVFGSGPIAPVVNASSAIPPFFSPVKLYGNNYIDGGIVDPVAVDVAKRFHPKIIIAVSLDFPLSRDIPTNSLSVFLKGVNMMLLRLNDYSAEGAQVIITPQIGETGMFDGDKRLNTIHAGEVAARKALPTIKKLLLRDRL